MSQYNDAKDTTDGGSSGVDTGPERRHTTESPAMSHPHSAPTNQSLPVSRRLFVKSALTSSGVVGGLSPVASPTVAQSADKQDWPQFQFDAANTGYNPEATGPKRNIKQKWHFSTDGRIGSSPAVADGTVFIGSSDGNVYALDVSSGTERWRFSTGAGVWGSPAVTNDTVVIGSNNHVVYALDVSSGTERWRFSKDNHTSNPSVISSSTPVVTDGTVFVEIFIEHENDIVYALDVSSGTERWHFSSGGGDGNSPAVADGTVFVGNYDNVYALDTSSGTEHWRFSTDNYTGTDTATGYTSPTVADGTVFVGGTTDVHALDASTGTERWRFSTDDIVHSAPAVADGTVFVGSYDSNVYALDASTGTERWNFSTSDGVNTSPAVVDGAVFVGSYDSNVYALDASTGTERWHFSMSDGSDSSPAVVDGTVFIGSRDGNVYAIEGETSSSGTGAPSQTNIDQLDQALINYRKAVMGYLDAVIDAKAEGYASQYLREETDGLIQQRDDRSWVFRTTIVRFFKYRAGIATEDDINLGYFDDIRALTDTIPEELSDSESEKLYHFTDEMFDAVPSGAPDEIRDEATTTFRNYLLGNAANQTYELTINDYTLAELKNRFASKFHRQRRQFIDECGRSDLSNEKIDDLSTQISRQTEKLNQTASKKTENYDKIVSAAVNGEQVLSKAEVMQVGGAVGSVIGGAIGLGVGLLAAGPTGEEVALIGIGTSVGGGIGSTVGGLTAPILTSGQEGGNRWSRSFVKTDTWKAVASFECQWLYNFKQAPSRILPGGLLDYAGSDYDAQSITIPEALFELGCSGAASRIDLDVIIKDIKTAEITTRDQVGNSPFARQDGTITIRNPDKNELSITPMFLRNECEIVSHTTAKESKRGYLILPPRSDFPKIAPGETGEVPFSYVAPLQSNADYEIKFQLKPTPVSTTIRSGNQIVSNAVGLSDAVDTDIVAEGSIAEGQLTNASVESGSATRSVFNLSYPGSDLDLHLYNRNGEHIGMNYQTGGYENQIAAANGSGPDLGQGFESIELENSSGTYTAKVVALSTPDQGSAFSVTNATSDTLPPSIEVLPTEINTSGTPDNMINDEVTIRETGGGEALTEVMFEPTELTMIDGDGQIDASRVDAVPSDITVEAGKEKNIELSISVPEDAAVGKYTGRLDIAANGDNVTTRIPIELWLRAAGESNRIQIPSFNNLSDWLPVAGGAGALGLGAGAYRYLKNGSDEQGEDGR